MFPTKQWASMVVAIRRLMREIFVPPPPVRHWGKVMDLDVLARNIADLREDCYVPSWNVGIVDKHLKFRNELEESEL